MRGGDAMKVKIDLNATKHRLFDSGRTITGFARANRLNPETVRQFLHGTFGQHGNIGQSIVSALDRNGLLVVEEEETAA